MARLFDRNSDRFSRKYAGALLALVWFCGLVAGVRMSAYGADHMVAILRDVVRRPASFGDLLVTLGLPLVATAAAVHQQLHWLVYGIAFTKAAAVGFVSAAIGAAFGSAGWLIRFLLLFSDILICGLLYYYWLTHLSGIRRFSLSFTGLFAAWSFLIVTVDDRFIAPLLERIISF